MKRALISVSDKTGLIPLAQVLNEENIEIISSGGTYQYLVDNNIKATEICDVTNFPEILDGRVKTLHPAIHGGILFKREDAKHCGEISDLNIHSIDYVIVNLYPFEKNIDNNLSDDEMIELIDIGGPTLLRSAAKNYNDVLVVIDPNDYEAVIDEIRCGSKKLNRAYALKVFKHTAYYDKVIFEYFDKSSHLEYDTYTSNKQILRYGENPHQLATFTKTDNTGLSDISILHGKELSYNNILDVNASLHLLSEFNSGVMFSLKHSNPCAIAIGNNSNEMYDNIYNADSISIFGGIVATNLVIDETLAKKLNSIFLEIIIAKDFEESALNILTKKKNIRLIKLGKLNNNYISKLSVMGGLIEQETDITDVDLIDFKVVGKIQNIIDLETLKLSFAAVKHVKSNAIVVATAKLVVGVGAGQMNRIDSAKIALDKSKRYQNLVLASDAFFPFPDIVELCSEYDVKTIITPGGSINDQKVIEKCDELNISIIFTNVRCFKH